MVDDMKRLYEKHLLTWINSQNKKPLILRGARQVGKSTLVKNFAENNKYILNEINLELYKALDSIFATFDITRIIAELEAIIGRKIVVPNSILFLDEIQATPNAIAALRYFYEKYPSLPVIAAGSLLEFVMAKHSFSMPVGRVSFMHLGPMTFKEFLMESKPELVNYIDNINLTETIPENAHNMLLQELRKYIFIGGMPESVKAFIETKSMQDSILIQNQILQSYENDFSKYASYKELDLLQKIFKRLPSVIGQKIKYVNIDKLELSRDIKKALDLLNKAKIFEQIHSTDCSGIPLSAHEKDTVWKPIFLDVGLYNNACGLKWNDISNTDDVTFVNEGHIAEQFIGQHLLYCGEFYEKPSLHYWLREKRSSNAEVDYVISNGKKIIPIEVKAGKRGTLKSLCQLVAEKNISHAVRFDTNMASIQKTEYSLPIKKVSYNLISIPLYAVSEIYRILNSCVDFGTTTS